MSFDEQTELMEAVLWAKGRGLIAGESGLLLWGLADVNPRRIHLAVPPGYRPRRAGGELYQIHYVLVEAADRDAGGDVDRLLDHRTLAAGATMATARAGRAIGARTAGGGDRDGCSDH